LVLQWLNAAENPPELSPNGLLIRSYKKKSREPKFYCAGPAKSKGTANSKGTAINPAKWQAKAWPQHHPECLTARGMPVPAMVEAK
jgi:hypothetical protein